MIVAIWSSFAQAAHGYQIHDAKKNARPNPDIEFLQRVSRGVSSLAEAAHRALVFVSIAKTAPGSFSEEIDPFEFFLAPEFRKLMPEYKQRGLGSGFLIDVKQGLIITNNHVIQGADSINVKFANGTSADASVVGRDPHTDVAVLRVKDKGFDTRGLSQLVLADSDKARIGEFVLVVGAPFGLEASLSFGVLSAVGRGNLNITTLGNFMQTDAAINPGNSGGPLINTEGDVIGMNTAIYSRSGASAGIGFAVPSNLVRRAATALINHGAIARGYLGVRLQAIDETIAADFGLPKGVLGALVAYVKPNSPAQKAGLSDGDIIVALGEKAIESPSELTNAIGLLEPGSQVRITYYRESGKKTAEARLVNYPEITLTKDKPSPDSLVVGGAAVRPFHAGLSDFESYRARYRIDSAEGLIVVAVEANSKAETAGLRVGDLLFKANRKALKDPRELNALFLNSPKVLVQIERQGEYMFTSLHK